MSDTFFSGAPHWTWFIVLYFFVGGIAGGASFLAAVLDWFGGPEDRPVARSGYNVAAVGAIVSGALLTIDLGRPLRFWHMLVQSANLPAVMFKRWSPISFGAWAILASGLFSGLQALGRVSAFATQARVVELLVLVLFVASLGSLNRVWVSFWGLILLVGVVAFGILAPLWLHLQRRPVASAARLVLLGGFLLRLAP